MPRPKNTPEYIIRGSKRDPNRDEVARVMKEGTPELARSMLSVTVGQRLRRREGEMRNVKGDRPPEHYSDA